MKHLFIIVFILIIIKLNDGMQFRAGFYSREDFPNRITTSGVSGITMDQQLNGQPGNVQIAVDPRIIPIFSNLTITLWNGTIVNIT